MFIANLPDINESSLKIEPIERSETIPSSWYTHPDFHQFDREVIFSRNWTFVGHINQLQNQGDYILGEAAGNPIIVIKDGDVVRAFYNVCRHRGGPLALDCEEGGRCGNIKIFQCKYHGWTYKLDGSLRGVPRFNRVDLFDKKDFGLIPVEIKITEGLIFIRLKKSNVSPDIILKEIAERISPIKLHTKKFIKRVNYEINCNWKVYIDNYLEGYHLPYVHPELSKLLDYKNYITEVHDYYSLQYSPLQDDSNFYGGENESAFYYFIFPNLMLNILPGRLQTNLVIPIAHNKCKVIFDYFYDDVISEESRKIVAEDLEYSDKIQQEDIEICEYVQRGLESMAYDKGRFSVECEKGVYHFQSLLKKAYSAYLKNSL